MGCDQWIRRLRHTNRNDRGFAAFVSQDDFHYDGPLFHFVSRTTYICIQSNVQHCTLSLYVHYAVSLLYIISGLQRVAFDF